MRPGLTRCADASAVSEAQLPMNANGRGRIMKSSVGQRMINRLTRLSKALKNKEALGERFTCRRVEFYLKPTRYSRRLVRKTRELLGASQTVFAQFLGVSVKTIRAWEQGLTTPSAMACRFMDEIRRDGNYWRQRLKDSVKTKKSPSRVAEVK